MSISVKIVTPVALAWEGEVEQVQVPGSHGEYGVLERHARMLTLNKEGKVILHTTEGRKSMKIGKGFVEVGPSEITFLVDSCEDSD